jgi:hypothetical protein
MAETTKLSVGTALEKLRGTDAPASKISRLEEQNKVLEQEIQRMRATRMQLEWDQRDKSDTTQKEAIRTNAAKRAGIVAVVTVAIILAASLSLYFWVK